MSIITRFANQFIKSRVINYGMSVDRMMTEMCKAGFQDPDEVYLEVDAMQYYETKFYSHIARKWNPRLEAHEVEQYQLAKSKFQEFEQLQTLLQDFHRITWEYRSLYLELTRELTSHNLWNRSENTSFTFEHTLHEAITKYIDLLKQLEDYPLWQERAKDEIGYYIHMIYNSTVHNEKSKEIFAQFDKLYYFK